MRKYQSTLLFILGFLIVVLSTTYISFAFFGPVPTTPANTEINLGSSNLGGLRLIKGEPLVFDDLEIIGYTNPSVKLTSQEYGVLLSATYDVYLDIILNEYVYTTDNKTAELVLRVFDENNDEITYIPSLEYVDVNHEISGFDITEFTGKVPIKIDVPIETNDNNVGVTQEWTFEIRYVDLESEQIINNNKRISANIIYEGNEVEDTFINKLLSENGGITYIDNKNIRNYKLASTSVSYYDTLTNENKIYYDNKSGLYSYTYDSNKIYYFRGSSENNWVYFAGYYFRILRTNSDNSIKMIYSGVNPPTSSDSIYKTLDTSISTSYYSANTTLAEHTGYMYEEGLLDGNTSSSNIKTIIDTWYEENMLTYASYIEDTLYCSDRSINTLKVNNVLGSGTGIGDVLTYYGSTKYIEETKYSPINEINLPCSKNNSFSVLNEDGNQSLTYPVALLSSYDAVLAGITLNHVNESNYLYTGNSYYTMSPYSGGTSNEMFVVGSNGTLTKNLVNSELDIRPVISVKGESIVTGSGWYNEPFVIK